MKSGFTPGRGALVAWTCVMAAAVAWIAVSSTDRTWLRSNVFELLPASEYDPLTEIATRAVESELATQLLFLVGHADSDIALASANLLSDRLREHRLIESVETRIADEQYASLADFYFPYRRQILSDNQLADIGIEDGSAIENQALATLYSPLGAGRAAGLAADPFLLFPDSLGALQPSAASLELRQGYLWVERDGKHYVLIRARLDRPTLSIAEQESLGLQLVAARDELLSSEPDADILSTGFALFAHAATQSAKSEISVIGVGSLIGVLLLVLFTFRSTRPLSLIALSVASGCIVALAVTLWVFGFVHLFTLVFGASLIGVSVDYSFHYVAEDAFGGANWSPEIGLKRIFSGITLGLLTSILAYLALTIAPFPGLRQLAVFSSAGLIGAYLTLICCCRLWHRRLHVNDTSLLVRAASRYLQTWRALRFRHRAVLVGVLATVALGSLVRLEVNDDIAALQARPASLQRQEAVIQEALGVASGGSFLLVSSSSTESLLQLEESIRSVLDDMIGLGELGSYQAVSRWVPSRDRQEQSVAAYRDLVDARLPGFFRSLGVPRETLDAALADLSESIEWLDIDDWLAHAVSADARTLWLGPVDDTNASIVLLFGVADAASLRSQLAGFASVAYVDKRADLSRLFGSYRLRVTAMLAGAYLVILMGLAARYGLRRAATVLVPPVLAGVIALAAVSIMGESLNLFHVLAMILVLGIGIDFTIFLAESDGNRRGTMFAITLSSLTTMLSFGLLSLSGTYAVHSFGITVLVGIASAYLLSPIAIPHQTQPRAG